MSPTEVAEDPEKTVAALVDALLEHHDPNGDRVEFMGAQFDLGWPGFTFP